MTVWIFYSENVITRRICMTKVAIYTRISKNNMGQDIDRQIHECEEYCKRNNYEIIEIYRIMKYNSLTIIYDKRGH